jgi:diguanylate cyclase (GGDEF)-like protein
VLANLLRHRGFARAAIAGLTLGLVALASLAMWSTVSTRRATEQVRVSDDIAAHWALVLVHVNNEYEATGDFVEAGSEEGRQPLRSVLGSAVRDLTWLRSHGDATDIAEVVAFRRSYTSHTEVLRQMVEAGDAGDVARVRMLARLDELSSSSLRKAATSNLIRKHQELTAYLAEVDERNRRAQYLGAGILAVDLVLLGLCGILLLAHQRRTERQAADNLHQARHDTLTGLANRARLLERMEDVVGPGRGPAPVALLLLDLDRFKEVNDTLGHHVGDLLLQEVAARLTGALPGDGDTVARLGGDEFAVLLSRAGSGDDAMLVARRLHDALSRPATLDGNLVAVGGSIGVAVQPADGHTAADLLQQADIAMYKAKRGRLGIARFEAGDNDALGLHLMLVDELRAAIGSGRLTVHYQPKLTPAGEIRGVEALVRWNHRVRGLLGPRDFVPLAESGGLIEALTDEVLRLTLSDQKRWRLDGVDLPVSVNMAAHNLMSVDIVERVADMLERYGTLPGFLTLEITESAVLADPRHAVDVLKNLRALGVLVAIDDFGVGYSSMAHLLMLPLDELKIDRTFVLALNQSSGEAIVRATVELGHALGLTVVAEGIEDTATLDMLREVGCDEVQGYHLCPPLSHDELMRWLARQEQSPVGRPVSYLSRG